MNRILVLIFISGLAAGSAAFAAPRTWTLQPGGKIEADLLGHGTNQIALRRTADGAVFFLAITNLAAQDRAYLATLPDKPDAASQAPDAKQPSKNPALEISKSSIEADPARISGSRCWMDAAFVALDDTGVDHPEMVTGFSVRDKDGALFPRCRASKATKASGEVLKLHPGDKVRLTGFMAIFPSEVADPAAPKKAFDTSDAEFYVSKVELLKSAEKTQP
jgi:hypothetical protein